MDYPEIRLLLGGEWIGTADRQTRAVVNPATGREIGRVPMATSDDLDRALDAAETAFAQWRRMPAFDRAAIMHRAAMLLRERAETIARLMTLEQGKMLSEARGEVRVTADNIDWAAEEGRRAYGRIIPTRVPSMRQSVLMQPIGPVAAFSPWNAPALMPGRKAAEALGAGCSVIVKPAEETPATAMEVIRTFVEAGLPTGALGMVYGDPEMVSRHLITSPVIRKVSFTGSTRVGKHLASLAGAHAKPATMELGGHAPVIVLRDADVERAVEVSVAMKARNAGQLCGSPTRFVVEEPVFEHFAQSYCQRMAGLKVGSGLDPASEMGPLANVRRVEAMEALVADARAQGGRIETGGVRHGNEGFFFAPTVISRPGLDSAVMNEEPFGPVSAIMPVESYEAALAEANRLSFGLAAYCFTRSARMAHAFSEDVEAGLIGINTFNVITPESPVSGVKDSGYGGESGQEGVASFLHTRHVAHLTE
jgi:succinate-semialdehyde dehydrogenase / glutarate-semialdehyde dehydrogenase